MAGFFKRRRVRPGPNKNQQKVLRGRETERLAKSFASLSLRYPSVAKLIVSVSFHSAQQHLLDQQTRTFEPEDSCDFAFPCSGECGTGTFKLGPNIDQLTAARQPFLEVTVKCQDRLYTGPRSVCNCEMKCKIEASYFREEEPQPTPAK